MTPTRRHDPPIGTELRGRPENGVAFVNPYRSIGALNAVERVKLARHPFESVLAVVDRYAKEGPGAIDAVPGEIERLKWAGIYPQRQGGDAFMLRVKVPGGYLTAAQAAEIGTVAETYGRAPEDHPVFGNGYADLTTRQDVQLHWVHIADVPTIWERFDAVGLTTVQACGDTARNVLCCPVSGVDPDEAFDALPVAVAISDFFTGNRDYANLPRKFKMSVTGCVEDCARAEINDIGLWPAVGEDAAVGFNLLVGGGLSDGERMASDIDVFVPPTDAVELCRAIAQLYGELGNREHRGLARMRYLVQELGPEGFRRELAARSRTPLLPAGTALTRRFRGDHVGVHPQRQAGLVMVGCSVPVGRMSGRDLVEAARLAVTYGDGSVRLGGDQNFVLTGVPDIRLADLLSEGLLQRYSPFPGPFARGVVACTGSEFCRFAVIETKQRALQLARALDEALGADGGSDERRPAGDLAGRSADSGGRPSTDAAADRVGRAARPAQGGAPIRLHVSGCSASCAQPQIADIGLRGATAERDGRLVEAVDIGLGGSLGGEAAFADWVEGRRPVEDLVAALVGLVRRYRSERRPGEPLHTWTRRQAAADLRVALGAGAGAGIASGGERDEPDRAGPAGPPGSGAGEPGTAPSRRASSGGDRREGGIR